MLKIQIPNREFWDEKKQEFVYLEAVTLQMEHSLVSISKWEAKTNKIFLSHVEKTNDDILEYIKCMTITQNVPEHVYQQLTKENIQEIVDYIKQPMSATTFSNTYKSSGNKKPYSSEEIYHWMIEFNISSDFEKWHLNRLLTLINICSEKNKPQQKYSKKDLTSEYERINNERRKMMHSKG